MRTIRIIMLAFSLQGAAFAQTIVNGSAKTVAPCSPAILGSGNKLSMQCGIGDTDAQKILTTLRAMQAQLTNLGTINEPSSGLSIHVLLKILPDPFPGKHFILDFGELSNNRISVYTNSDTNTMNFTVLDSSGERYSLEAPLGGDSIPLNEPTYLTVSLGLGTSESLLEIHSDTKEVRKLTVPKAIKIRIFQPDSKKMIGERMIGTNIERTSQIDMEIYYLLAYPRTLSKDELAKTFAYLIQVIKNRHIPTKTESAARP